LDLGAKVKKLNKNSVLLFIPKEIYTKDLLFAKRRTCSKDLFIYAITGIPLLYANKEIQSDYGYKVYTKGSLRTSKNVFNPKKQHKGYN